MATADLERLMKAATNDWSRRWILEKGLKQKDMTVAGWFVEHLDNRGVRRLFQENLTPELAALVKKNWDKVPEEGRDDMREILTAAEKDPVAALLALAADPAFKDRSGALWELRRYKDPRVLGAVRKIFREGKAETFGEKGESGIRAMIDLVEAADNDEAVGLLIEMLETDWGRFGKEVDKEAMKRHVAGALIGMTGESWGLDAAAWRKWYGK
jgi:hypothetical protein